MITLVQSAGILSNSSRAWASPFLAPRFAAMFTSQNARTRTTAPVVKHVCLFTRDLKRKHKRWQDGRLEFHTFNRRVMVYGENGNFIGDSHRMKDGDVEDGNEFQLDRGNVIVQVAELIGQREQDITEIITRKPKPHESQAQSPASLPTPKTNPSSSHFQLRHLPLQSLLSTPGRQIGRAVIPTTSPYEQRMQTPEDSERVPKRRRIEMNRSESHMTPVAPRTAPSPQEQPTAPVPQVPCNPPRRKAFSPPRIRNPAQMSVKPHKLATSGSSTLVQPNSARSKNIDLTSISPSPQRPLPSADHARSAQRNQSIDTPSRHSKNTPIHDAPARKRHLVPGKENRETVRRKRVGETLVGEKQAATSGFLSTATVVDRANKPKQENEPTTTLRLGSAQRRGLLVAKGPPSRSQWRNRIPAQPVGRGGQIDTEAMADADLSSVITPGNNTEPGPTQPSDGRAQVSGEAVGGTESPSEATSVRNGGQRESKSAREPPSSPRQRNSIPVQRAEIGIQVSSEVMTDDNLSPETIFTNVTGQREPDPPLLADIPASLPIDTPASESGEQVVVVKSGTETPVGGGAWSREADDLLDYKRGPRKRKPAS